GVADHSDFRADPWRRLQGTLRSYLRIVYGTGTVARAEIRRLNELHRTITGPTYRARDPELSLWVHATLVDSTIVVADRWLEPLSRARREAYYAETRPIARAFGIPDSLLPADLDAFEGYIEQAIGRGGPVRPHHKDPGRSHGVAPGRIVLRQLRTAALLRKGRPRAVLVDADDRRGPGARVRLDHHHRMAAIRRAGPQQVVGDVRDPGPD